MESCPTTVKGSPVNSASSFPNEKPITSSASELLSSATVSFKCCCSEPIRRKTGVWVPLMAKMGALLSVPKGARYFSCSTKAKSASATVSVSSMSNGSPWVKSTAEAASFSVKLLCKPVSSSFGKLKPTAIWCPPKLVKRSFSSCNKEKRLTWVTLRPEPLAIPSSLMVKTKLGFPVSWTKRPATIPRTPSCHPVCATTLIRLVGSNRASASLVMSVTKALRSSLIWLSSWASLRASSSSKVVKRVTAGFGSFKRPMAFSRGLMAKPIIVSSTWANFASATLNNSNKPMRSVCFINCKPMVTNARFSPVSETKSAIVPIATKSKNSSGISSNSAQATLKATPTPAKSGKGYCPCGCRGWMIPKALGKTSGSSWWSVTKTSTPRLLA